VDISLKPPRYSPYETPEGTLQNDPHVHCTKSYISNIQRTSEATGWNKIRLLFSRPQRPLWWLMMMSSYIGTFFMWNQISACFIFTWPEILYSPFLSAIYLDLVSDGTYRYWTCTEQVNVTCRLGSTLSWSAEF
jgi:hypothetical protein